MLERQLHVKFTHDCLCTFFEQRCDAGHTPVSSGAYRQFLIDTDTASDDAITIMMARGEGHDKPGLRLSLRRFTLHRRRRSDRSLFLPLYDLPEGLRKAFRRCNLFLGRVGYTARKSAYRISPPSRAARIEAGEHARNAAILSSVSWGFLEVWLLRSSRRRISRRRRTARAGRGTYSMIGASATSPTPFRRSAAIGRARPMSRGRC